MFVCPGRSRYLRNYVSVTQENLGYGPRNVPFFQKKKRLPEGDPHRFARKLFGVNDLRFSLDFALPPRSRHSVWPQPRITGE